MVVPNPLDVSVIICAYTDVRWDDLVAAIASLQRQTCPSREIIVVSDHNPALLARAHKLLPDVTAVVNSAMPGASGSRNTGVSVARGAVVAFIDDDAVAAPDWLEQLAARYEDPLVLGVGGSIEPLWVETQPSWFPMEFGWVVGSPTGACRGRRRLCVTSSRPICPCGGTHSSLLRGSRRGSARLAHGLAPRKPSCVSGRCSAGQRHGGSTSRAPAYTIGSRRRAGGGPISWRVATTKGSAKPRWRRSWGRKTAWRPSAPTPARRCRGPSPAV